MDSPTALFDPRVGPKGVPRRLLTKPAHRRPVGRDGGVRGDMKSPERVPL